jgi:hypothetical protein
MVINKVIVCGDPAKTRVGGLMEKTEVVTKLNPSSVFVVAAIGFFVEGCGLLLSERSEA